MIQMSLGLGFQQVGRARERFEHVLAEAALALGRTCWLGSWTWRRALSAAVSSARRARFDPGAVPEPGPVSAPYVAANRRATITESVPTLVQPDVPGTRRRTPRTGIRRLSRSGDGELFG